MSAKGNVMITKILDTAKELFSQKGYMAVTMKDFCDCCDLSRGGLYHHFSSTKEIFIAMLDRDVDNDSHAVQQAMEGGVPAQVIFDHYLAHEKNEIFSNSRGIHFAIHEFAFVESDKRAYFDKRVEISIQLIRNLLCYGQERGEFRGFDANDVATHIIYFFDAMKTSTSVITITKETVDKQIEIIKEMIL